AVVAEPVGRPAGGGDVPFARAGVRGGGDRPRVEGAAGVGAQLGLHAAVAEVLGDRLGDELVDAVGAVRELQREAGVAGPPEQLAALGGVAGLAGRRVVVRRRVPGVAGRDHRVQRLRHRRAADNLDEGAAVHGVLERLPDLALAERAAVVRAERVEHEVRGAARGLPDREPGVVPEPGDRGRGDGLVPGEVGGALLDLLLHRLRGVLPERDLDLLHVAFAEGVALLLPRRVVGEHVRHARLVLADLVRAVGD